MRRMSIVVLSGHILFIAACTAPPESPPPPATASATVFEGARLITGDEGKNADFLVLDANPLDNIAGSRASTCEARKSIARR